jgi:TRAP-type C4-dicarboxylate transport system substrate-binding protein
VTVEPLRIRVGGYAPAGSTHSRALAHFRDQMSHRVGGAVDVDVLDNVMDLGRPATDLFTMVESGELLFCYFSASYLGPRVPEHNAMDVPFLFRDLDAAHAALDGEFGAYMTRATEHQTPYEVLGYWDNGFRHMTNRLRPIHAPSDVAGMTVRLQPNAIHEAMIARWGGVPVCVELSEAIRMIGAGEVDAQENPLANSAAYGVDRVHGHVTMSGHLYGARGVYANPGSLAALPPGIEEAVRASVVDAIAFQRGIAADYEAELRSRFEQAGLTFVDLTEAERAEFIEVTQPVIDAARADLGEGVPWPT